ncbi:hypothetical protein O6H91_18G009900 [Diphasiastrum complanatum]|uniref:Uncharacterized protein n=1 Tax=Diphasiastrum complanatum TaxID=34168 RepID=A0ACC2AY76_DIPCM|nr:hypothetical protein O6H91_18G009900 [Diphasiastrum complanatum]
MEIAIEASAKPAFLKPEDGVLLTMHEADCIVEKLTCFDIEQVGGATWLKQQKRIEKLNLQAHYNAIAHCDEYVMAALVSHDKMGVLMHELLVIEIWKEKVFPCILQMLIATSSTLILSLVLAQESSIINLFEVILFHRETWDALDENSVLEVLHIKCFFST